MSWRAASPPPAGPPAVPPHNSLLARSSEWMDGYNHGYEDGRRVAPTPAVVHGPDPNLEVAALKSTIRDMENELARQRNWERHVMGDRDRGSGAELSTLRGELRQKDDTIHELRAQLRGDHRANTETASLRFKLESNEKEVTELRQALAECLESLRLKESVAPAALETRVVSLESQIHEAKQVDGEMAYWQNEARRLKMELDGVVTELRKHQMDKNMAVEHGFGDAKRAWDALQAEKMRSEAEQRRFSEELRHERQRFDELVVQLDSRQGDDGLLDEARRLTAIERERGDALEAECEKMKLSQRETLDESQALVKSLQLRTDEAARTDAILKQMKIELSEAVRLEELSGQRESNAREDASEERTCKEKEIVRCDSLQRELNKLRQELADTKRDRSNADQLQALIDQLEISLSDERNKSEAAAARISQFDLQLEDLRSQVKRETERADTNMRELEHTKELHMSTVSKLRKELSDMQAVISRKDTQGSHEAGLLKDEIVQLTRALHALESTNQDLQAKLAQVHSDAMGFKDQAAGLSKQLKDAFDELKAAQAELDEARLQAGKYATGHRAVPPMVGDMRAALQSAEEEAAKLRRELDQLYGKGDDLEGANKSLSQQLEELRRELRSKDEQLTDVRNQLKKALDELEALRKQLEAATNESAGLLGKHKSMKDLVDELRSMLKQAEDELDSLRRENSTLHSELESSKNELVRVLQQLQEAQEEASAQQRLKDAALVELQRAEDEIGRLRRALEEAIEDAAAQRRQKEAALVELQRVEDELSHCHRRCAELEEELARLRAELARALASSASEDELARLRKELAACQEELARLRKALQKAEDEAISLRRQQKAAEAEAAKAKEALAELKVAYKKLQDELAALRARGGPGGESEAELARLFTLRLVIQNWESYLSRVLSESFALWKEIYNLAREDATRKACATQLLRKYIAALLGDPRARALSRMRSNHLHGKEGDFHHDEDKDRIFAEALARARAELPFLWEAEAGNGEWKAHEPSVCAQLEDAIVRQKDQLAVTSQRKSYLMWIHGRTQIDVATGRNHGLRRRKPEIAYKTVQPSEDLTIGATPMPGASPSKGGAPGARGGKPPRSPSSAQAKAARGR